MLVTDRDDLYERVLVLRDHGRQIGDTMFRNAVVAFKYKMSAVQAALGLAQLERVEELVTRKRDIFRWYQRELAGMTEVRLNAEPAGTRNSYWMVTAIADRSYGRTKEEIIANLRDIGIDCRPFFYPLSSLDAYRSITSASGSAERNPNAYELSATGVNLPSALSLTEEDVERASRAYREALGV